mmetsp:Transcript_19394/g.32263  ORF Transcript_19394/g.32263 Transcript_19394/m.32263 type:complete len:139 (-) Transcript_19394:9-425(-)
MHTRGNGFVCPAFAPASHRARLRLGTFPLLSRRPACLSLKRTRHNRYQCTQAQMSSDQNRTIFCFGLGYTALNLVEGLLQEGWTALGTTKDPDKAQALSLRGIKTFILDSNAELPDLKEPLSRAAFVLSSIPPDGEYG